MGAAGPAMSNLIHLHESDKFLYCQKRKMRSDSLSLTGDLEGEKELNRSNKEVSVVSLYKKFKM
jgi:hypothetical protein